MSLLQLFIQALSKPPPVTSEIGTVGLSDVQLTRAAIADSARAAVTVGDQLVGAAGVSDAPVNPG